MGNGSVTTGFAKPAQPMAEPGSSPADDSQFDEETYLRFNPDVRVAVGAGAFRSGRDHYERYGRAEGRPYKMLDPGSRNHVIFSGDGSRHREAPVSPASGIDFIRLSGSGGIFIAGWVNDAADPLDSVDLYFANWSVSLDGAALARVRRPDAEANLNNEKRHAYGFWGFMAAGTHLPAGQCSVVVRLRSKGETGFVLNAEIIEDDDLYRQLLAQLAGAAYFGNAEFAAAASLDAAIGEQLVAFAAAIGHQAVTASYVEEFGQRGRKYRGSIIICLSGHTQYMFLQNAAFASQAGIQDYEFIYVCNSAELGEQLLKEARLCLHIYGLDQIVLIMPDDTGYAAANNAAIQYARSDRLLLMSPLVFPKDPSWVLRHGEILSQLPPPQTALFGVPLYYDDGSLMHGGRYFEIETVPRFDGSFIGAGSLLRVEYAGRGAPPGSANFLQARPVSAVSGAFISIAKAWFETLGGFTPDYVFGGYEDADLCLKSRGAGRAPWLHNLKLWHLQGKADPMPGREGGRIVDRWLFSKRWRHVVAAGLAGPAPAAAGLGGAPPALKMAAGRGRKA